MAMKLKFINIIFLFTIFIKCSFALSPTGTWVSIDDKTEKPRSEIKVWESYGKLYGKIIKVYGMKDEQTVCTRCTGSFKDKLIKGLTIMWDLDSKGNSVWGGGKILDPESGKIYNVKIKLSPSGNELEVRGYIGVSTFGRTQKWTRKI